MILDEMCGSPFWDSRLAWDTDYPEFTPCFQNTVLTWGPCLFLWIFSPLEIYFLIKSESTKIPWSWLNLGKIVVIFSLVLLSGIDAGYVLKRSIFDEALNTPMDKLTPLIKFFTFILAGGLGFANKAGGIWTSGILFLFWLFLALCGMPQYIASLIYIYNEQSLEPGYHINSYLVYYPVVLASLILNSLDDLPAKSKKKVRDGRHHPRSTASFPSKMLFLWFEPLLWKGFRKPLEIKDLWPMVGEDSAHEIGPKFDSIWKEVSEESKLERTKAKSLQGSDSSQKNTHGHEQRTPRKQATVLTVLWKHFGPAFVFGSSLRILQNLLALVSPLLLSSLINFAENRDEYVWHGYLNVSLLFVTAFIQTIVSSQYIHRLSVTGLKVRAALMSSIYRKALKISNLSNQETTVGEIVNLMAVDAERVMNSMPSVVSIFSAPVQAALVLYFLSDILGVSVLAGLAMMLLTFPINGTVAAKIKALQIGQMKDKDKRIQLMNEVLSGVKVMKLYAWEESFEEKILLIREAEVRALRKAAYLNSITLFISNCAPFLVSLATFAVYVLLDTKNVLTVRTAFVSLSLFNILQDPLTELPMAFSNIVQLLVSLRRIDAFMNKSELNTSNVTHNDFEKPALIITDGCFSWDGVNPVLQDINFQVAPDSLVAVVGPVGSGKSSLLNALLSEIEKTSGRVNVKGSVAYVSQEAWIQNASLRDNILFGKQSNPQLYSNVVEACALTHDFDLLPAGDSTEIGEKGINLSVGQKQRVSLARAVYQDRDVYLLDDPLSAVDSHVGAYIFENVIGPKGLLNNKTRVLVTHSISHLQYTDQIFVIKDGKMSESGTYNELMEKRGAFRDFLLFHQQDISPFDESKSETDLVSTLANEQPMVKSAAFSSNISSLNVSRQITKTHNSSRLEGKNITIGKKLIHAEKVETGRVQRSVYLHYFRSMGWVASIGSFVSVFVYQAFSIGANIWLSEWASESRRSSPDSESDGHQTSYLEIYAALGVGQAVGNFLISFSSAEGMVKSSSSLHFSLLKRIFRAPASFFDTTPTGRIVNRFSQDVDAVDNSLPLNLRLWQKSLFAVLGVIFVISYSTPLFVLVMIPVSLVNYVIQRFYVVSASQLQRLTSITRSPIYSHFKESVSGVSVIRAFRVQNRFIRESEEKVDLNQACVYMSSTSNHWLAVRLETLGNVIVLAAGFLSVLGRDTIGAGFVGLSISYAITITRTINFLVKLTSNLESNIVAVERMKEYAETEQEAPWRIPGRTPPSTWPDKGEVVFKNFAVRYRPGLDPVLKGITFTVKGGEKVGIVGRTGAGKSSITLSLFRIIEAAKGAIYVDNVDISSLGLHDLRSRITIIPQEPVLFSGSLRFNLDPIGAHSDDSIWRALELSHLQNFVKSLPDRLEYEVAEGGKNLSVGQRQLICLARALLRKTKVLVLDEATASVDLDTDALIQTTIRSEFMDCTVLTIAHRLNTILDSDRILVMDQGVVVEYDTPCRMLLNRNSLFFSMAKAAGIVRDDITV